MTNLVFEGWDLLGNAGLFHRKIIPVFIADPSLITYGVIQVGMKGSSTTVFMLVRLDPFTISLLCIIQWLRLKVCSSAWCRDDEEHLPCCGPPGLGASGGELLQCPIPREPWPPAAEPRGWNGGREEEAMAVL